jgi:hypothetical protein
MRTQYTIAIAMRGSGSARWRSKASMLKPSHPSTSLQKWT